MEGGKLIEEMSQKSTMEAEPKKEKEKEKEKSFWGGILEGASNILVKKL